MSASPRPPDLIGALSASKVIVEIEARKRGNSAILLSGKQIAVGRGAISCAAARELIHRGYPPHAQFEVWRDDILCLRGELAEFARLTVEECSDGVPRFRLYRPRPSEGSSPIDLNRRAAARDHELIGADDAP